jgi:hypothetical protein
MGVAYHSLPLWRSHAAIMKDLIPSAYFPHGCIAPVPPP